MSVEEILLKPNEEKIKELNRLINQYKVSLRYVEDYIFNSNNARLICLCGKYIEKINKGRVANSLNKTLESYYILDYAYYIQKQTDINETSKKQILDELAKGMCRCTCTFRLYFYARDIAYAPINKIANIISDSKDSSYIFYTLRDLGSKLDPEIKESLERRIIELKDSAYIVSVANMSSTISIDEFAFGLLDAKRTDEYGAHLYLFLCEHEIPDKDIEHEIVEALIATCDYRRIIDLIKSFDNVPYKRIINILLNNPTNYSNPNFWLNYIIPLAIANEPYSNYAIDKIVKSGNIEFITIALYYIENEAHRLKLTEALNRIPNLHAAYDKANLNDKVIQRVLISKRFNKSHIA